MRTLLVFLTLNLVLAVGPPALATKKKVTKKDATSTQEATKKKVAPVTVSEVQNPGEIAATLTASTVEQSGKENVAMLAGLLQAESAPMRQSAAGQPILENRRHATPLSGFS